MTFQLRPEYQDSQLGKWSEGQHVHRSRMEASGAGQGVWGRGHRGPICRAWDFILGAEGGFRGTEQVSNVT